MLMPGRSYSAAGAYRYGFNGKEQDPEIKGTGAQYDYGFRIYDPRMGKFFSVDPLARSFPWNSPYSYAEGDIIRSIDLDGLEKYVVTYWYNKSNELVRTTIKAIRNRDSKNIVELNFRTANGQPLTTRNVHIRHLYLDGTFKDHVPDKDKLSPSEQALFDKAISRKSTARPARHELMNYNLGDQKGGGTSRIARIRSTDPRI
jgi:RHS repeat-associated protein